MYRAHIDALQFTLLMAVSTISSLSSAQGLRPPQDKEATLVHRIASRLAGNELERRNLTADSVLRFQERQREVDSEPTRPQIKPNLTPKTVYNVGL